jgi:tetratricopeptide (TPR) repeat protein
MDNAGKAFEYEGNQVKTFNSSGQSQTVSQEDLKAALSQPHTQSEKMALTAEKTKSTVKALKNKLMGKINGIKSNTIKNAVIIGGAAAILVILAVGGIFFGRMIYDAYIVARDKQTEQVILDLGKEMTRIGAHGTDEEKQAVIDKASEEAKKLENRSDKLTWRAYSIKAGAESNAKNYEAAAESLTRAAELAPASDLMGIYENLFYTYNSLKDKAMQIRTVETMMAEDVFGKAESSDISANSNREFYIKWLEKERGKT